jgi:hypothetical protein
MIGYPAILFDNGPARRRRRCRALHMEQAIKNPQASILAGIQAYLVLPPDFSKWPCEMALRNGLAK